MFLMLLEVKLFVTMQDKASKETFFLVHIIFQSNLVTKIQSSKIEKCHTGEGGGGIRKEPKEVSGIF
jgi:hypothetical protein